MISYQDVKYITKVEHTHTYTHMWTPCTILINIS